MANDLPNQSTTAPLARADLHLHTNLGDGTASPQRVLEVALSTNRATPLETRRDDLGSMLLRVRRPR